MEVNLCHTPYFHMQKLAIILELFSILYLCYYSQNYSGIIISGLISTQAVSILVSVKAVSSVGSVGKVAQKKSDSAHLSCAEEQERAYSIWENSWSLTELEWVE